MFHKKTGWRVWNPNYVCFFSSSFSGGGGFGDDVVEEKSMVPIPPYCDGKRDGFTTELVVCIVRNFPNMASLWIGEILCTVNGLNVQILQLPLHGLLLLLFPDDATRKRGARNT